MVNSIVPAPAKIRIAKIPGVYFRIVFMLHASFFILSAYEDKKITSCRMDQKIFHLWAQTLLQQSRLGTLTASDALTQHGGAHYPGIVAQGGPDQLGGHGLVVAALGHQRPQRVQQ